MPETYPLGGVIEATPAASAAVTIADRRGLAIVQLMAAKGQALALAERLGIAGGPGRATTTDELTALPLAPGQWLLIARSGRDGSFARMIAERARGLGHASDQSHGRACLRLSGAKARELLQKGCRLDIHPRAAGPGFCAQTPIAQIGVLLHQIDDTPTYDLYLYPGLARSFLEWLEEGAAQYGYATGVAEA